jgi:hypothetical protein
VPVPEEQFSCPDDLTLVSDAELSTLRDRAEAEFERVNDPENLSTAVIQYAMVLTDSLDRLRAELEVRKVRADLNAKSSQDAAAQTMARLAARVHGNEGEPAAPAHTLDEEAIAAAAARGVTQGLIAAMGPQRSNGAAEVVRRAAGLSATQAAAPDPKVQTASTLQTVIAVDMPGRSLHAGANVPGIDALAEAFIDRAKSIPATAMGKGAPRYQVASIKNEFSHTVDDRTSPAQIERLVRDLTSKDRQESLLAGGGWCAPSEIKYDLFNISDTPSGMIDLPTVGVSRGGIMYPTSPAISDVFYTAGASNAASGMGGFAFAFSNASDPWLWSETDDILTVTGSVNKPTLRVPCASFNTTRLEAYGLTLTAGNLTDSAYPEATQNFLRLLRNAYAHAMNARLISLMQTASTNSIGIGGSSTMTAFNGIMNGVELAAVDYRNKFAMSDTAVLECVLPTWVLANIRADLAWRTYGDDSMLSVPDSVITGMFADRGIAVQFVSDWQVRGSGQFGQSAANVTAWQTTAKFMLYAAGTFLHGTGLSLDLGIVRDSILNAENDFTAAWAEEAHLIAKVGHESRLYTVTYQTSGAGSGTITPAY